MLGSTFPFVLLFTYSGRPLLQFLYQLHRQGHVVFGKSVKTNTIVTANSLFPGERVGEPRSGTDSGMLGTLWLFGGHIGHLACR